VEGFLGLGPSAAFAPGSERVLSILGRKILLRREQSGVFVAFELACRHQNADLSTVQRKGALVVCPRHGWVYDLTTGACVNESWAELRRFEVCESAETVWLAIQPRGASHT